MSAHPAPVVAVATDRSVGYPDAAYAFAPGEHYPELLTTTRDPRGNGVYALVRRALAEAGFDAARQGSAEWNPLAPFVRPGARVMVLCNFVHHQRPNESAAAFASKCTHASVIRPIIDYALRAAGPTGHVTFGNAPLQSANWERVQRESGGEALLAHYRALGASVDARDLRLVVRERSTLGHTTHREERDAHHEAVEVELGGDSLLDALYQAQEPHFRVADYDPRRLTVFHARGTHRYVIHRAVLDADVVISVPKLKTHEKVGITCGLKGFVGAVGHKDCLAHHRFGSPDEGGDEYPAPSRVRSALSELHDQVQMRAAGGGGAALQAADKLVRRVLNSVGAIQGGAWHGNDTTWRMTLDLARVLRYADRAGRMAATPQRIHLCVIDGVVAGEGEGPLRPDPVACGTIIASAGVEAADWVAARLMGYDPARLPLLRHAYGPSTYPLAAAPPTSAVIDGTPTPVEAIEPLLGRRFRAPPGWRDVLEAST
jgi:uncharacterized protein (DUF362 family)